MNNSSNNSIPEKQPQSGAILDLPAKIDDAITPATIWQINRASLLTAGGCTQSACLLIDGMQRKKFNIIGQIVQINTDAEYCVEYLIDDGTGKIIVRDYTHCYIDDGDADGVPIETFQLYKYVNIFGKILVEKNISTNDIVTSSNIYINAFSIKLLEDFNMIPYHMMLALFSHLFQTTSSPDNLVYETTKSHKPNYMVNEQKQTQQQISNKSHDNNDNNNNINIDIYGQGRNGRENVAESLEEKMRIFISQGPVNKNEILKHFSENHKVTEIVNTLTDIESDGIVYSNGDIYEVC